MTESLIVHCPVENTRPSRRWYRPRTLVLGLLLICLAVGAYFFYRFEAGRAHLQRVIAELDRRDPGWRLEDLEARRIVVSAEQNSALRVAAIEQQLPRGWWNSLYRVALPLERPEAQFNEYQAAFLRRELSSLRPMIAEARKLADQPKGRFLVTWSWDWICSFYRHPDKARTAAMLLRSDAIQLAQDGNVDEALASLRAGLNAGRSLFDDPTLLSQMNRNACRSVSFASLERVLAQGQPSETALSAIQALLEDEEAQPVFLIGVRGERALADKFMGALAAREVTAAQLIQLAEGTKTVSLHHVTGLKVGSIDIDQLLYHIALHVGPADHAAVLEYMDSVVQIAKLPTPEHVPRLKDLENTLGGQPAVVRVLASHMSKAADQCRRIQALLRCAVAALAAERYRQSHGQWPDSLSALVPQYLQRVPADPYDGAPLRSGRDDGGVIERKHFRLVGVDIGFQLWDLGRRRQRPINPAVGPPLPDDDGR